MHKGVVVSTSKSGGMAGRLASVRWENMTAGALRYVVDVVAGSSEDRIDGEGVGG